MTVELFSKNGCVQCNASERALKKFGVDYAKTNMSQDMEAFDYVINLGFQAAPVILVKDDEGNITDSWSGFNPDKIAELAA